MGDLQPSRAKRTFGRDPRRSPESRFLSAGGSETRHSCHFVFVLWRASSLQAGSEVGCRDNRAFFFFFKNTNTRQMEINFSSLRSQDIFQLYSISKTINIAVIPVIILLLLDAVCREKCPFFILQDCKSFLSRADERTVGTELRPADSTD